MVKISLYAHKIMYYAFLALFFFTPLIFYPLTKYFPFPWFVVGTDPFTYELFEYNKMFFVYGISVVILIAWIIRCLAEKKVLFRRTFIDYALGLFLLSQVFSTIYSMDVHTSIWGYYSRFHGGMLSTISYLVLYWAFVSNFFERKYAHRMLVTSIASAGLVALYGIAQRLGIDAEYWVQNVKARVFSTLGQPNWLAAYMVAMLPITLSYFLFEKRMLYRILYGSASVCMFLSLVFTASRSGLLALVVGLVLFAVLIYIKRVHAQKKALIAALTPLVICAVVLGLYVYGYYKYSAQALNLSLGLIALSLLLLGYSYFKTYRMWIAVLGIVIVVSGFFNFSPEAFRLGSSGNAPSAQVMPQEAGGVETGRIRLIVWDGAWEIFKKNPVFGSGVETFAYSFYANRPLALLQTTEWDFLYNKAHNEYLNFLATTGAFGLGAYLFYILHVLVFSAVSFYKLPQFQHEDSSDVVLLPKNKAKQKNVVMHYDSDNYLILMVIGLTSGFVTILITNFFGFSVVNVALCFFLFSSFLAVLLTHERRSFLYRLIVARWFVFSGTFNAPTFIQQSGIVLTAAAGVFVLFNLFSYWFADIAFADGRMQNRQSQIGLAHTQFLEALNLRRDEPFYYSELGWTQGNMVYSLMQENDASNAAELVPFAEENSRKAVEISPNNVNYWKKLADVYYNLTFFDKSIYDAKMIQAAARTQTLAPTDVSTLLTLSIYYEAVGNLDEAYRLVENSTKWKPDLGQAWYRLGELAYRKYQKSNDERYRIDSDEYRYKATQLEPTNEDFKRSYE